MKRYKVLVGLAIFASFAVLSALEGGAINPGLAVILLIPLEGVMLWALDRSGWIDSEAVADDWKAMRAALARIWTREASK